MNKLLLIVCVFIYSSSITSAQSISNITAAQSGKSILVNYTLKGKEGIAAFAQVIPIVFIK